MCVFIIRVSEIQYVKYGQICTFLCVCFPDCRLSEYEIQESEAIKDIDTIGLARKETEVVGKYFSVFTIKL